MTLQKYVRISMREWVKSTISLHYAPRYFDECASSNMKNQQGCHSVGLACGYVRFFRKTDPQERLHETRCDCMGRANGVGWGHCVPAEIDSSAWLISVWRSKILSVATARYRAAHAGSGPSNATRLLAAQRPLPSPVTKMRVSV